MRKSIPFVCLITLAVAATYFSVRRPITPDAAAADVPIKEKHPVDPNPPKPTGEMVDLAFDGGTAKLYVNKPEGKPAGAVLVHHEWWGLNDWVKAEADELAKLGYVALAVDLYDGQVAKSPDEAGKLMGALNQSRADKIEAAGIQWLKTNAPGAKIATIGWCMGGGQSLLASLANAPAVAATIIYYGVPVDDVGRLKTLKGPVLGIYAKKDGWITPEKVDAFDKKLTEAGVKHEIHEFDADHGFANPTGGRYNPGAAKDAWTLTVAFLAANLK